MRLIDADWVLEHIKPYERSDEKWSVTGGTAIRLIHNAIDTAPTAKAVSVTRCKDCKFRNDRLYCRLRDVPVIVTNVDFCSYGKPKGKSDGK